MKALKLDARIEPDRTLHLRLPADVGEGPAEVIVLLPESSASRPRLADVVADLGDPRRARRSKQDIDRALEAERTTWDE